jgi:hypothetical protein
MGRDETVLVPDGGGSAAPAAHHDMPPCSRVPKPTHVDPPRRSSHRSRGSRGVPRKEEELQRLVVFGQTTTAPGAQHTETLDRCEGYLEQFSKKDVQLDYIRRLQLRFVPII